jgi:small nuclear ribonucleoprotein (snRNP)-like protein
MAQFPELLITRTKTIDENGIFSNLPSLPYKQTECGYTPPQPSTNPEQQALEQQLSGYIGKQIKIKLIDGREYIGIFYCYDSIGNVVLDKSFRLMPCGQKLPSGTAMAPPHTIVSVQVKK